MKTTVLRGGFIVLVVVLLSIAGYVVPALIALSIALLMEAVIVASRFDRMSSGRMRAEFSPCVCMFTVALSIIGGVPHSRADVRTVARPGEPAESVLGRHYEALLR